MEFPDISLFRKCTGNFISIFPVPFMYILVIRGSVVSQVYFLTWQEIPIIMEMYRKYILGVHPRHKSASHHVD